MRSQQHLILLFIVIVCYNVGQVHCQRSFQHRQRDLLYRLQSYLNTRKNLDTILGSSIFQPTQEKIPNGATVVSSGGSVRFSDLIIPNGALILGSHVAQPTLRQMVNKTDNYVRSKIDQLNQIKLGIGAIRSKVDSNSRNYIYKGSARNQFTPQFNSSRIPGTWVLKQFTYGHMIESQQVDLKVINYTNVDQVMRDVYMENPLMGARDSQNRIFFEGRKTFWNTVFKRPLRSGCCDRLRPIHTSRVMTRSSNQQVLAPVLFQTNDYYNKMPIVIDQLVASQIYNRILAVGMMSNRPDDNGLVPSREENIIRLPDLIHIRQPYPTEIYKTIIFKEFLSIEEAQVFPLNITNRGTGIGILTNPGLYLDLSYDNYLYKYSVSKQPRPQRVIGSITVDGGTYFARGIEAKNVNSQPNFGEFVRERIVRIDRPSIIYGPVQINAMHLVMDKVGEYSRPLQDEVMVQVDRDLIVGDINGMRIPNDIVRFPFQFPTPIVVRGRRVFENPIRMMNSVTVQQLVNNMQMPHGVIPLHLNDFMHSVRESNLWFLNGIYAQDVTVQSGKFDDIHLKDVHDPQSLIMQSVIVQQADGSRIIRAPLQIMNLTLINEGPNTGLLNGFRPQDLIEFSPISRQPSEIQLLSGKTFLSQVEARECLFAEMNKLSNWTNLLIRVDRPNTVQTVHTRLLFINPPYLSAQMLPYNHASSSVQIDRLSIEFYPNNNPVLYQNNLNISPEFYVLQQALIRTTVNHTEGRYRVLDKVQLLNPNGLINGVDLKDIVTVDQPFKFGDRYVMVGKVDLKGNLMANRITSNYPIDVLDLEQFNKYRIPIAASHAPIRLNHLALSTNNQASFVQCKMVNGISFNEFANSIMSLTRPQIVESQLMFGGPVNFEGFVRTGSSLNEIPNFRQFAQKLKDVRYSFEDGLQCNSIMIRV